MGAYQRPGLGKLTAEVIATPRREKGPVKFGIEHDVRPDKENGKLSPREARVKAAHYQDNSDR